MRHIISILLQNEAGALARVAGMFSARGYNIESLTVAPTHDDTVSRLTLVTTGSDAVIEQIIKQSRKLIDVVEITDLTSREHLESELLMLKVEVNAASSRQVVECARRHRAQILDETEATRTVQLTGTGVEVNGFLAEVSGIARVLELVRSGTAALERGNAVLAPPA
ncbi:MAG: acetolactate synthase small subunit [Nevskia sp.]|nr:acetolactate synthase small subunit [Nevskia sp.]